MSLTSDIEPGFLVNERYEIVRQLGRGGFAVVYEGRDRQIDRPVAIKVMTLTDFAVDEAGRSELVERFSREAKTAAWIDHPNVAQIFDFGVVEPYGEPFIVMELMKGRDLDHHLRKEGPLAPERCLPLFVDCLHALGLAHQQGIVHKDLKPANLFLKKPGTRFERLCIFDFGVAHVEHEAQRRLTREGQITGTAAYIPPEYATDQIVTPALDVYQMGLILIESLAGEAVVDHPDEVSAMFMHVRGDLRIPAPLLDSPLGPIVRKALNVHYKQRYQEAREFAEELAEIDPASIPKDLSTAGRETIRTDVLSDDLVAQHTGQQKVGSNDSGSLAADESRDPASESGDGTRVMYGAASSQDAMKVAAPSDDGATDSAGAHPVAAELPVSPTAETGVMDSSDALDAHQRVEISGGRTNLMTPAGAHEFEPPRQEKHLLVIGGLVAVVLCIIGAAFVFSGSPSDGTAAAEVEAEVDGEPAGSSSPQTAPPPSEPPTVAAEVPGAPDADAPEEPELKFVIVSTEPAHAAVYEGDRKLGTTPLDLEFFGDDDAARKLRFELEGYETVSRTIGPTDERRVELRLEPKPKPKPKPKPAKPRKEKPQRPKPGSTPILLPD